jgi:hypothetical protein
MRVHRWILTLVITLMLIDAWRPNVTAASSSEPARSRGAVDRPGDLPAPG